MIECRFSLELTKNGIQKSVYAKTGEVNSRMLVVTLTQNGKVYDLEEHTAVVFLETGENFSAKIVNDTVQAVIPDAFSEPQVRICELRISKGDKVLYSPKFEIVFEESFGNKAESESLENGVRYVIKSEHDADNSHTIGMISSLRAFLDNTASKETVTNHYDEMNAGFRTRDEILNNYAKRTDANIVSLQESTRELKATAHTHTNKSLLDKLSTSEDGELLFDGELIKGSGGGSAALDVEVKTNTEDEYVLEITTNTEVITTPNLKGKPAYQSAVDGGYKGTEEEFNSVLADIGISKRPYTTHTIPADMIFIAEVSSNSLGIFSYDQEIGEREIKAIRVKFSDGEILDIRDMHRLDDIPYVLNVHRPYYSSSTGDYCFGIITFSTNAQGDMFKNSVVESIESGEFESLEVDYYTD